MKYSINGNFITLYYNDSLNVSFYTKTHAVYFNLLDKRFKITYEVLQEVMEFLKIIYRLLKELNMTKKKQSMLFGRGKRG